MAALACPAAAQLASVNATFKSTAAPLRASAREVVAVSVAPIRCSVKSSDDVPSRRMIAATAAAALMAAMAGPVLALGPPAEPPIDKKGSKEAKKKFANICVAQPTASICHG